MLLAWHQRPSALQLHQLGQCDEHPSFAYRLALGARGLDNELVVGVHQQHARVRVRYLSKQHRNVSAQCDPPGRMQ